MIHSKAIDVLKTFTKEELKHFNDFILSPFHNKNKNIIKLFNVLRNCHPDFEADNEKIFLKVYPGKPYNHSNMKKIMSELHILTDNFLIQLKIYKEKFLAEKFLLQELLARGINDYFLLRLNKLDNLTLKDHQQCKDLSDLEDIRIDYFLSVNKGHDTSGFSNKKCSYDLCYFLFQSLDYINNIIIAGNTYNTKTVTSKYRSLVESLELDSFASDSALETNEDRMLCLLSNLILMNLKPENEIYFKRSKKIFMKYFQSDGNERCNDYMLYYSALISNCRRRIREKKTEYISEEFDLLKNEFRLIKRFNDNVVCITWSDFANAVLTGLEMNRLKWTEDFIIKSKRNVNGNDYDYLYTFGKGMVEFKKGDFEKSLEHFSKIYFKEHLLNIAVRHQMLMCYYELDLFEHALTGIDSYCHLIRQSDKFNERNRSLSKYFIDMYRGILRLKSDPSKINEAKIKIIQQKLEKKEFSFSDKWFEMKLCELEIVKNNLMITAKRTYGKSKVKIISA